jgi:hypothetical protein
MLKLETKAYLALAIMCCLFGTLGIIGSRVSHEASSAFMRAVTDFYLDLPTSRFRIEMGLSTRRMKTEPFIVPIALLICYAAWVPFLVHRYVFACGLVALIGMGFWGISALVGSAIIGCLLLSMALSAFLVAGISHFFSAARLPLVAFLSGCASFGLLDVVLVFAQERGWIVWMFLAIFQFLSVSTAAWVASIDLDDGSDDLFVPGMGIGRAHWFPVAISAPFIFFLCIPVVSLMEDDL